VVGGPHNVLKDRDTCPTGQVTIRVGSLVVRLDGSSVIGEMPATKLVVGTPVSTVDKGPKKIPLPVDRFGARHGVELLGIGREEGMSR